MSAVSMMAPSARALRAAPAAAGPVSLPGTILKIDRLMDIAFFPGRTERSAEYRAGCRAALEFRLVGRRIPMPYVAGCAAADAFSAGIAVGHAIWRRQMADYSSCRVGI